VLPASTGAERNIIRRQRFRRERHSRIEMTKLYSEHGALHAVHPIIESLLPWRPIRPGPVPQHSNGVSPIGPIGDDHPRFTARSEVLAGIEAEAPGIADATTRRPLYSAPWACARVFNDYDSVTAADL